MLKDLMYQDRVNRDYGLPREPTPQTMPPMEPLPPVEDFLPEFEVREPETTQTTQSGQAALEIWALESQRIRDGKDVPAIHRHSNAALHEVSLKDARCPNCGCEFAVDSAT